MKIVYSAFGSVVSVSYSVSVEVSLLRRRFLFSSCFFWRRISFLLFLLLYNPACFGKLFSFHYGLFINKTAPVLHLTALAPRVPFASFSLLAS
jgi:hypothetical protein